MDDTSNPDSYRCNAHLLQHSEQGKLPTDCFATASGCSHQHIVICVVQSCEDLCLNWVEGPEPLVQLLKLNIPAQVDSWVRTSVIVKTRQTEQQSHMQQEWTTHTHCGYSAMA